MTDLNAEHEDFKLTFEVAIIEHLGLNLYSEVHSAISELIANAYDADATTVTIDLPIGVPLGLDGQKITITDDGHGMDYEDCRDKFLRIGRNRRKKSPYSRSGDRRVIGKKGIGKLAGFGIANQLHIRTIHEYRRTEFILNLSDLRQAPLLKEGSGSSEVAVGSLEEADLVREYKPTLVAVEEPIEQKQGTTVVLEKIRPLDAIDIQDFLARIRRKFAIFSDQFTVKIVDSNSGQEYAITKFDVETQFRFPAEEYAEENISTVTMGSKPVKYWIGFTRATIKDDAVRGITVVSNGKSVQEPFDFKLAGGVEGQFGLQYMTGEVIADWLDDAAVDVIASDRASVRWSDPDAQKLLDWGRSKVKTSLAEWAKLRASKTVESLAQSEPSIIAEVESYKGEARKELERVIDRVVAIVSHLPEDRVREIVMSITNAYRYDHIRTVLNKVIDGEGGYELFAEALAQWDLIDAVLTFQELSVKLSAIHTLRILILGKATEVKSASGNLSLHEHLAEHPWLIDPMFSEMQHEKNIDKFILEKYGVNPGVDDKRLDFVLLYDSERVRIVEIKSAKDPVDERGMVNLMDYHGRIKAQEATRGNTRAVKSLLVYNGQATAVAANMRDSLDPREYEIFTWGELLERNARIYKEQLQHVREKNPDDPRIVTLAKTMNERLATAGDETATVGR